MNDYLVNAERLDGGRPPAECLHPGCEAFAATVDRLNRSVEQARDRLELAGISIEDRSGCFGRDLRFRWFFHFVRIESRGPKQIALSADIICLEPKMAEAHCDVEARWTAEIFQPGQPTQFKHDHRIIMALEQILRGDLAALIHHLINRAENVLPEAAIKPVQFTPSGSFRSSLEAQCNHQPCNP